MRPLVFRCLQVLLFSIPALAGSLSSPPPGGIPLLLAKPVFSISGPAEIGSMRVVPVEGMPFDEAMEVQTLKQPEAPWKLQMKSRIPTAFKKGDVLWISVWMRATETSSESRVGLSQLTMELATPPGDHLAIFEMDAGESWQQFAWTLTASRDCASNSVQLCFVAGFRPQVIQLGGFQILDYGTRVQPKDLPESSVTYPGMEANASWRAAAADRIEKLRKASIKINVTDTQGNPVCGATVGIKQTRHEFGFGSCVVPELIVEPGADNDRYREIIRTNYNKVVVENSLKWPRWEASAANGHAMTLEALRWLREHGIEVRGHNLVWPSFRFTPKDLVGLKEDKQALEQRIENHIKDEVGATKGMISEWDVVNEPFAQHEILDLLGPGSMTAWFKLAHEGDPKATLYLNDFAGLMNRGENTPHKDAFERTLRMLQDSSAPVGGLGIQAHFSRQLTGPEQILQELDRWARLGLAIQITEFDVNLRDEQLQAQYTRDFMTSVFSHPAVNAILMWGFWEGAHWIPQAALYRKDWEIKPNGKAWNELVLKEWHTELTATTDTSGSVSTRGFRGDYDITIHYKGRQKTWPLVLPKEGAKLSAVVN